MPAAVNARPSRNVLLPLLGGIVVLAWIALWWLEQSPYGWLFHRHGGTAHGEHGQPSGWLYSGAFLVGWLLMTIAMMLPTTVPVADVFRRLVLRHGHAPFLIALLLAGYLGAWLVFGVIALVMIWTIDRLLAGAVPAWVWATALFLSAGAFQFSSLKYACLDKCRSPLGFVLSHWHGRNKVADSFNVGWSHGLFCVGCCWALMMLMFAVSVASLGWMLFLAVVMAVEKNAPWGRRLTRPLGLMLLSVGVGVATYNLAI